jgi:hypothetical protein
VSDADRNPCGSGCDVLLALLLPAGPVGAQVVQGTYNPRDDQYRVLGLVRAQAEYERAEAQYLRGPELADKQLIPQ